MKTITKRVAMPRRSFGLACALAAAQAGSVAQAQGGVTDLTELEEVIVTANKRSERLIEVPLSVTALGDEALTHQGVRQLDNYVRLVPGVSFNDNGPGAAIVSMRGVNTSNTIAGQGSTVGFSLDDVPIDVGFNARATVDMRLFDMERLEVLRGPQGTLHGAGALSGQVRMITQRPALDAFAMSTEVTGQSVEGGAEGGDANLMLNVPLVPGTFGVRATAYYTRSPGFIDNIDTGENDQNTSDSWGGRLQARWQANDALTVDLSYAHQEVRNDAINVVFLNPAPGSDPYTYHHDIPNDVDVTYDQARLAFDLDLGWATLSDVTAYSEKEIVTLDDASDYFSAAFGAPVVATVDTPSYSDYFTQELRLASNPGGSVWQWTAGAFYSRREGGFHQVADGPAIPVVLDVLVDSVQTEQALFGEISYTGFERFEITAGGRYFQTDYKFDAQRGGLIFPGGPQSVDSDESQFNPKFSISYLPDSDLNIYLLASKGWRSGGYNSANGLAAPAPATYDSDTLWSYELGVKSRMLGGRLDFAVAAYHLDWEDIQIQARDPVSGFNYNDNAGSAAGEGVEVELRLRPGDHWEMGTSFALTQIELSEDTPVFQATGVAGASEGDRLPASAEFSISNFLELRWSSLRDLFVRLDHQYVGASYTGFDSTGLRGGDFHLLNARAGVTLGSTDVSVFVNNLLDADEITNPVHPGIFDPLGRAFRLQPRTLGVTLRMHF